MYSAEILVLASRN